jgi:glucosamine-6-phosphate deaminase
MTGNPCPRWITVFASIRNRLQNMGGQIIPGAIKSHKQVAHRFSPCARQTTERQFELDISGETEHPVTVNVFQDRCALGEAAALDIAAEMRGRLARQAFVRIIFAAAPSQGETLQALRQLPGIDWPRVVAFQMDEYIGLPKDAAERFSSWLRAELFSHVPIGSVRVLETDGDENQRAKSYARQLSEAPVDLVCLGIGMNGHIAFNDPLVADISDQQAVKPVELEEESRHQQVVDGCFPRLDLVPTRALTLTIPRLLNADKLFCMVPGATKRAAVGRMMREPIGSSCPATALRLHPHCRLYLDKDSSSEAAPTVPQ